MEVAGLGFALFILKYHEALFRDLFGRVSCLCKMPTRQGNAEECTFKTPMIDTVIGKENSAFLRFEL